MSHVNTADGSSLAWACTHLVRAIARAAQRECVGTSELVNTPHSIVGLTSVKQDEGTAAHLHQVHSATASQLCWSALPSQGSAVGFAAAVG